MRLSSKQGLAYSRLFSIRISRQKELYALFPRYLKETIHSTLIQYQADLNVVIPMLANVFKCFFFT